MESNYEYKFVRLGEGWAGAKKSALKEYKEVVHKYAKDGWRLVQVFAPSFGIYGVSKYVEVILEREIK